MDEKRLNELKNQGRKIWRAQQKDRVAYHKNEMTKKCYDIRKESFDRQLKEINKEYKRLKAIKN